MNINKSNKCVKAVIFAGLPPPIGGISSIVAMLHQSLGDVSSLKFVEPIKKSSASLGLSRSIRNTLRLITASLSIVKDGRILFFASSGLSFYEKLLWVLLARILGRQVAIVMVDGNFPLFWEKSSNIFKLISCRVLIDKNVTIGVQSKQWHKYYSKILPNSNCLEVSAMAAEEFRLNSFSRNCRFFRTILFVGWLIPEKGLIELIQAFSIFSKTNLEARLRLIGPFFGNEDYWHDLLKKFAISDRVDLVGPIYNRKILVDEFNAADSFVLPSHFEGFPVALIEAMTLGLPCIGTDVGGIPDILDNGNAGIIVPPNDADSLLLALNNLSNNHDLRIRLSETAKVRAKLFYTDQRFLESYLSILNLK